MTKKAIVLAHGLFMKKGIMTYLKSAFERRGFVVYNFDYKTTEYSEKTLSEFHDFLKKVKEEDVNFVGHSMGGLLIRNYFDKYKPKYKSTSIVTLGTPHKGSSLGLKVKESIVGFILGNAPESGVTSDSELPPWSGEYDLGVIIGIYNVGPNNVFNYGRGEGDGTVLVSEAILENAKDTIYIGANHTGLVYSRKAVKQVISFIETRKFKQ